MEDDGEDVRKAKSGSGMGRGGIKTQRKGLGAEKQHGPSGGRVEKGRSPRGGRGGRGGGRGGGGGGFGRGARGQRGGGGRR